MSEKYINDLNIEYLINKEKIKYFENNKLKNANKKDKKFYRKRILNLTKDFLLFKETEEQILPDVKCSFELYVKTCIEYFKILDRHDIIQEDYSDLEEKEISKLLNSEELNIENINNENEANSLLMRSINIKPSLEKFIKRTTLKKEEILPIQKEINLEEPYLKNKGICKKKNIYNNYGEVTNKEIEKK